MPMTNIEAVLESACEIGMAYKADTLEELAEMTGMDIEILMRNINDYNAACAAGEDTLFYKNPAYLYPYDLEGPFYAVVGCVMSYNSLGGVKVDELMRVADTQDQPIPGLYSAGVDSIGTRPGWRVLSQPVRRGAGLGLLFRLYGWRERRSVCT